MNPFSTTVSRSLLAIGAMLASVGSSQAGEDPRQGASVALRPGVPAMHRASPFMRVFGPTLPPIGYVLFCERNPRECAGKADSPASEARLDMTPRRWRQLSEINIVVNRTVEPASDREIYGVEEVWTYPYLRGDCEDYVLLKRRMLVRRGWPGSALLITVVRDEERRGHAVLTVRTSQGDYLLDNKTDVIRPWFEVPYEFIKRQSSMDPQVWVSLRPESTRTPAHMAGVPAQERP